MPLLVRTIDLQPGTRLARALRTPDRGLIPAERPLKRSEIQPLIELRPNDYVSVASPDLDRFCPFQDDSVEIAAARRTHDLAAAAMHLAKAAVEPGTSISESDFNVARRAVAQIDRTISQNRILRTGALREDAVLGPSSVDYACRAVPLSMILCAAVRDRIIASQRRAGTAPDRPQAPLPSLTPLGMAAIFRDAALWARSKRLEHAGPLNEQERQIILDHPTRSAEMLPACANPATVAAIRDHHENDSGTGYPRGINGSEIPLFARILRMADAYCAATVPTPYRAAKSPAMALWEMTCGPYTPCYDPAIRKIFQTVVHPYPIGSVLRLQCGRQVVVVRHGKHHGLLPEVIIAFDEVGRQLPRMALQGPFRLERCPDLRIAEFRGEDLSWIYGNDTVTQPEEVNTPANFREFAESVYP